MQQRGLDENQELPPQMLLRDTRTLGMKTVDFFKDPIKSATLLIGFAMVVVFFTALADLFTLIAICVFFYAYTREFKLPFRMPQRSGALDYNDPLPGNTGKPRKARGITFFGNRKTNGE